MTVIVVYLFSELNNSNFIFNTIRLTSTDVDHNNVSAAYETTAENCVFQDDVSTLQLHNIK